MRERKVRERLPWVPGNLSGARKFNAESHVLNRLGAQAIASQTGARRMRSGRSTSSKEPALLTDINQSDTQAKHAQCDKDPYGKTFEI